MLRSIRGVAILDPYKSVIDPPFVIHLHDRAIKLNNCKSRAKTSTQCLKLTRNASLELHAKILFLAMLESGTFLTLSNVPTLNFLVDVFIQSGFKTTRSLGVKPRKCPLGLFP